MKPLRLILPIYTIGLLVLVSVAVAQDADKAKLIEIEKAFAANANPGAESAAVVKQYAYDGTLTQLTPMGRVGTLPKATLVELSSKPDPSDPDVKSTQTVSDFHVDIYGTTALVSYKQITTDTGHKEPALNTTYRVSCLDTFVKNNGAWYVVGNACSSSNLISPSVWAAGKKAMAQAPKEIQQAYH